MHGGSGYNLWYTAKRSILIEYSVKAYRLCSVFKLCYNVAMLATVVNRVGSRTTAKKCTAVKVECAPSKALKL